MISQREIEDSEGQTADIYGVTNDETSLIARLKDNRMILVPIHMLQVKNAEQYFLSQSFNQLHEVTPEGVIPVIEEVPTIRKKNVITSRVKIKKSVQEKDETVEESLAKEEVQVTRIPLNEVREEPAQIRVENETTIIPVQEEILVVQKKILIREEVHIRKITTKHNEKVTVNLKKEEVTIDRKKIN